MSRPSWDEYFMSLASIIASRSTCLRRQVGVVLVDKNNHIIGTGYNGVASGLPHCNHISAESVVSGKNFPHACSGSNSESGTDLDSCESIHAEQNALLQCRDTQAIEKIYTTTSPCITCTKLLMATSCKEIIFAEEYSQWSKSQILWESKGRTFKQQTWSLQ